VTFKPLSGVRICKREKSKTKGENPPLRDQLWGSLVHANNVACGGRAHASTTAYLYLQRRRITYMYIEWRRAGQGALYLVAALHALRRRGVTLNFPGGCSCPPGSHPTGVSPKVHGTQASSCWEGSGLNVRPNCRGYYPPRTEGCSPYAWASYRGGTLV
jgi:hypothetical protein